MLFLQLQQNDGLSLEAYYIAFLIIFFFHINDLVDGKLVKVNEEHRFNSSNHNVIIANMDYWEHHFAKIIQKNWRICRYNPRYSVCKKILNEQFDDYLRDCN